MMKLIFSSLLLIIPFMGKRAYATSTLERNIVECTISSKYIFEEIILKFVKVEDGGLNVYEDYVLDYTKGSLQGASVDVLGVHEQLRQRIFTSANSESDGVLDDRFGNYQMFSQFDHSELIINLSYEGKNQNGFKTYSMSLDGDGPVYDLIQEKYQNILSNSEYYNRFDEPLCVTHFDLREFVSTNLN